MHLDTRYHEVLCVWLPPHREHNSPLRGCSKNIWPSRYMHKSTIGQGNCGIRLRDWIICFWFMLPQHWHPSSWLGCPKVSYPIAAYPNAAPKYFTTLSFLYRGKSFSCTKSINRPPISFLQLLNTADDQMGINLNPMWSVGVYRCFDIERSPWPELHNRSSF